MNSEMVFCPRCGAVTRPGVCTNCGYNIENDNTVEKNEEVPMEEVYGNVEGKKSSKGWLIGLILGLALIAFLIIFGILLLVVGFAPFIIKTIYGSNPTINNYPTTVQTPPTTPLPSIDIDTDDDDDDDEDEDDTDIDDDDDDTDDGSDYDYSYLYSESISGLYSSASEFDEDKFNELVQNGNEFTDEVNEDDYFTNGIYYGYSKSGASHDFAERDSFPTPYYVNFVNSYIENENYDVERHVVRYEGENNGVHFNAYCAYYSLSSDKVDYTDINKALREQSVSELYRYLSMDAYPSDTYSYTIYSDSVITFNNDEVFSVAYDVSTYRDTYIDDFYIHGVNADVKNGILMDNTKVLNMDDDFSKFFVTRSNTQNSYVEAINECTPEELTDVLNDDDALIMVFTPLGIEVGINYRYLYNYGWVTITINNFDQYLSGEYSFTPDWGKGYDIYKYEKENGIEPKEGYDYDWDIDYETL